MPFPDVPRVIYAKNPLIKVICQLRFPPILKIDSEIPANYQDRVRKDYPLYQEKSLDKPLPGELKGRLPAEIVKFMFNAGGGKYEFASADRHWAVTLAKDSLALTAHEYNQWEEFINHFERPLNGFVDEYSPSFYSRIGLRYQNVIQRSILGLKGVKWSELLKPYIAGVLATSDVKEEFIKEVTHSEVIELQDGHSQVRIVHRFVKAQDNELCYLIDNDFFTEQRTEKDDAIETLKYFNRRAGRLFRWCISERLHEAMEPKQI